MGEKRKKEKGKGNKEKSKDECNAVVSFNRDV